MIHFFGFLDSLQSNKRKSSPKMCSQVEKKIDFSDFDSLRQPLSPLQQYSPESRIYKKQLTHENGAVNFLFFFLFLWQNLFVIPVSETQSPMVERVTNARIDFVNHCFVKLLFFYQKTCFLHMASQWKDFHALWHVSLLVAG